MGALRGQAIMRSEPRSSNASQGRGARLGASAVPRLAKTRALERVADRLPASPLDALGPFELVGPFHNDSSCARALLPSGASGGRFIGPRPRPENGEFNQIHRVPNVVPVRRPAERSWRSPHDFGGGRWNFGSEWDPSARLAKAPFSAEIRRSRARRGLGGRARGRPPP